MSGSYILGANMDMIDLAAGRQARLDRPGDRLARVPGRRRLQRPHLLHLASQRLRRLADLRRGVEEAARGLGAAVTTVEWERYYFQYRRAAAISES